MNEFKHSTVAPEIHVTTQGDLCPNCFEFVVYQYEPGRPVTTQVLVRALDESDREWWSRVLEHAKALQQAHPVYKGMSVVTINAIYDDETDARMLIERVMWKVVRFDPSQQARKEALMLLADLYGSQATRAVH